MAKKEHSDFGADSFIFHDVLPLVTASSPFCSLGVALSKSVSCVHTATSEANLWSTTADACSSMLKGREAATGSIPVGRLASRSDFGLQLHQMSTRSVIWTATLGSTASCDMDCVFLDIFINEASLQTLSLAHV